MIKRKNLRTKNIKLLVMDEADEMLSMGFKDQIYDVYRYLPPTQVDTIFHYYYYYYYYYLIIQFITIFFFFSFLNVYLGCVIERYSSSRYS